MMCVFYIECVLCACVYGVIYVDIHNVFYVGRGEGV